MLLIVTKVLSLRLRSEYAHQLLLTIKRRHIALPGRNISDSERSANCCSDSQEDDLNSEIQHLASHIKMAFARTQSNEQLVVLVIGIHAEYRLLLAFAQSLLLSMKQKKDRLCDTQTGATESVFCDTQVVFQIIGSFQV